MSRSKIERAQLESIASRAAAARDAARRGQASGPYADRRLVLLVEDVEALVTEVMRLNEDLAAASDPEQQRCTYCG
jgi:hypothetical protein